MKAITFTLAGREATLAFTGEAMFTIREKFGDVTTAVSAYTQDTREAMEVAVEVAAILAEQGELARRAFGYDKKEIVSAATIKATVAPSEIYNLKAAITAAIELGFGREVENETEIDLGLAELQTQKKTT